MVMGKLQKCFVITVPLNHFTKSQRFLKNAIEEINYKVEQIEDKLKFLKSVEKLEVMEFVENSEGDAIRFFQKHITRNGTPKIKARIVKST